MSDTYIGTVITHCGESGIGRLQIEGDSQYGLMFYFNYPTGLKPGTMVEYQWNPNKFDAFRIEALRVVAPEVELSECERIEQEALLYDVPLDLYRAMNE